jgi:hypothetical protein
MNGVNIRLISEIVYEPFDDGWSGYEEPSIMVN